MRQTFLVPHTNLQSSANVSNRNVALLLLVDDTEAFGVHVDLSWREVDWNLVLAGSVDGQTHFAVQEVSCHLHLTLLLGRAPLELLSHDVADDWKSLLCGLTIQESETKTTSNHVDGGARVFADAITDLSIDVRELWMESFADDWPSLAGQSGELGDWVSAITIRLSQVLGDFAFKSEILHQTNVHGRSPSVRAFNLEALGEADGTWWIQVTSLDGSVDSVLSHGTVCRPLATSDGDQLGVAHVNDVVTSQRLSVALVGVRHEWTDTRPR